MIDEPRNEETYSDTPKVSGALRLGSIILTDNTTNNKGCVPICPTPWVLAAYNPSIMVIWQLIGLPKEYMKLHYQTEIGPMKSFIMSFLEVVDATRGPRYSMSAFVFSRAT